MKWHRTQIAKGEERIREHFLWFPKRIRGQWRWLERAKYLQRYLDDPFPDDRSVCLVWVNVKWL